MVRRPTPTAREPTSSHRADPDGRLVTSEGVLQDSDLRRELACAQPAQTAPSTNTCRMLGITPPPPLDPGVLKLASDLRRRGLEPTRADLHHLRHGVWVEHDLWQQWTPGQRHAALVHATALCLTGEPVFCRTSAAAVWGLPLIEPWPAAVRTLETSRRQRGSTLVRSHLGLDVEAVQIHGIRVTPVPRTVIDLARTGSLVSAVAAADHALRHDMCTPSDLSAEVAAIPRGGHGRAAAQLTVDLAEPESMSPGESLSRVQMFLLDLPRPRLQVAHHDDEGRIGIVDFDWPGVVGEFDGKVKYRVPAGCSAEEAAEIVWREKLREDRLRRGAQVARWTWQTALNPDALAATLARVGIRATARNTWIDLKGHRRAG